MLASQVQYGVAELECGAGGIVNTRCEASCLRLTISYITSHHIETTDAGLDGLCIREINVYHTNL